jgi:hypothetical protein
MPRSKSEAEALERLRERLQKTQEAAQRLADEATGAASSDRPPPSGWDVPRRAEDTSAELEALLSLLATLREVLPPELRQQLADLVKALLQFVRAVVDFAIGRLEAEVARRAGDDHGDERVQDIPIT